MGRALSNDFPIALETFQKADQLLGFSLSEICFEGPEEALRATEVAQPALYIAAVAAWRCLQQVCPREPDALAGHSVGEYAALTAAGSLSFEQGVMLVRRRGELMRDAARRIPGTMAAVLGIDAETARSACEEARACGAGIVGIANYNGGGQIVISGEVGAVEKAGKIAVEKGARRVKSIPVSGAFHSPLMVSAGDALFGPLSQSSFRKPGVPVVSNVTARYIEMPDDVVGGLTMQVSRSVRWEESMQLLLADGVDRFVELGSGDVLCGLMRRIDKDAKSVSVHDPASLAAACNLIGETAQ